TIKTEICPNGKSQNGVFQYFVDFLRSYDSFTYSPPKNISNILDLITWIENLQYTDIMTLINALDTYAEDDTYAEEEQEIDVIDFIIQMILSHQPPTDEMPKKEAMVQMMVIEALKDYVANMKHEMPLDDDKDNIVDIFIGDFQLPIEIKIIKATKRGLPTRNASNLLKAGLGACMIYKNVYGKSLLLIFTNSTDYARYLRENVKQYESIGCFIRIIDWNEYRQLYRDDMENNFNISSNFLKKIQLKHGKDKVKSELRSLRIVIIDSIPYLEIIVVKEGTIRKKMEKLDFIIDGDKQMFSANVSAETNASVFVEHLDEYSIRMCFDIFS
ncbi:MAG: hypothetical protein ACTSQE_09110, partial [Candidatus Heimdallarchaeaceae archaeon]